MNRRFTILAILVVLIALAVPRTALARGLFDDRIVAGGTFTLRSGESLDGNLVIFGGAVTLENGSTVNGDVVLLGGTIDISGTVNGSVVGIGGVVSLRPDSVVRGDLTALAASLDRDPGARVEGQVITGLRTPFRVWTPGRVFLPTVPRVDVGARAAWDIIWFLFRTFLWAALAVLVVMFLPGPTERVARSILAQPVLAGGVGLLTTVVAPLLLIVLAITLILIPVSLLGVFFLAVAWFFGRIAIGLEIGRRMAMTFKQDWPPAVAAGIGTFSLTLVVDGMDSLIPCIGWIFPLLIGIIGLGGVLLTRFGTQQYPPTSGPAMAYPAPPPPTPVSPAYPPSVPPAAPPAEPPVMPPDDLPPEDRQE